MVNKIIIDKGDISTLYIDKKIDLEIIVNKNVDNKLLIIGTSDYNINITLMENSKIILNSLNKNNSVNININLHENSNITYNHSVISKENSINNFSINHKENNSTSILNNNGINLSDGKLFFNIDGIVPKNMVNINCNQSSKILNFKNGNSKIIPNLIIDSNDIIANHAAYIGKINDEEMFYLSSRGINKESIKKLIYKGTMLNKMNINKEEVNQILNEWW